uniref:Uncharacterized protein n=1 Tax=Picea sitchensis TaxID=3332 RepID=A0A6B9XXX1_PICSI|nr:hypothetical protein Q903MT_gene6862 [Picea sitchensis]
MLYYIGNYALIIISFPAAGKLLRSFLNAYYSYICNYALAAEEISGCIIYVISLFIIEIEMWWMHLFVVRRY